MAYLEQSQNLADVSNPITASNNIKVKKTANALARPISEKLADFVSALDYGADSTGVADSSVALQKALNDNPNSIVYVPAGTYRIDHRVQLNQGQSLIGEGRSKTIFKIAWATCDHDVFGYFIFRGVDSCRLEDIFIKFVQPDVAGMTRNDLYQYPPAIYAANSANFLLDRVRISRAWIGVYAPGNSGGATIGDLEVCSFAPYLFNKFTASASGSVLTVTAVDPGTTIKINAMAYARTGATSYHYRILSQIDGVPGGAGHYQIDLGGVASFISQDNYQTEAGVVFDGQRDFSHLGHYRFYFLDVNPITSNLAPLLFDQTTCALAVGYSDGFSAGTLSIFRASVVFTPAAGLSGSSYVIDNLQFDLSGADLHVYSGLVNVKYLSTTKSTEETGTPILVSGTDQGTTLIIGYMDFLAESMNHAAMVVTKGNLTVLGGQFNHGDTACPVLHVNGASASAAIMNAFASIPNVDRTAPYFYCQAGGMRLINVRGTGATAGRLGPVFKYDTDSSYNCVENVHFSGWSYELGFSSSFGYYHCNTPVNMTNVIPRFPADVSSAWGYSNSVTSGYYIRKGDKVDFYVSIQFDINDYSSDPPAGPFEIALNDMPVPRSGQSMPVAIGALGKVAFAADSFVTANMYSGTRGIRFNVVKSGQASADVDRSLVPSGATGVKFVLSGSYFV